MISQALHCCLAGCGRTASQASVVPGTPKTYPDIAVCARWLLHTVWCVQAEGLQTASRLAQAQLHTTIQFHMQFGLSTGWHKRNCGIPGGEEGADWAAAS